VEGKGAENKKTPNIKSAQNLTPIFNRGEGPRPLPTPACATASPPWTVPLLIADILPYLSYCLGTLVVSAPSPHGGGTRYAGVDPPKAKLSFAEKPPPQVIISLTSFVLAGPHYLFCASHSVGVLPHRMSPQPHA